MNFPEVLCACSEKLFHSTKKKLPKEGDDAKAVRQENISMDWKSSCVAPCSHPRASTSNCGNFGIFEEKLKENDKNCYEK